MFNSVAVISKTLSDWVSEATVISNSGVWGCKVTLLLPIKVLVLLISISSAVRVTLLLVLISVLSISIPSLSTPAVRFISPSVAEMLVI